MPLYVFGHLLAHISHLCIVGPTGNVSLPEALRAANNHRIGGKILVKLCRHIYLRHGHTHTSFSNGPTAYHIRNTFLERPYAGVINSTVNTFRCNSESAPAPSTLSLSMFVQILRGSRHTQRER